MGPDTARALATDTLSDTEGHGMRTVHAVGLDVSLCHTGVAELGCAPAGRWTVHTFGIPTAPVAAAGGPPEPLILDRMNYIVSTLIPTCEHADVIAIERPAYAAKGNATSNLAGLWWLVFRRMARLETPIAIISASSVKKYATNNGNAAKREVSRATARMWPDVDTRSGDEDDALVLASMAADMAGLPVPYDRTNYRRHALNNIARPEQLEPLG